MFDKIKGLFVIEDEKPGQSENKTPQAGGKSVPNSKATGGGNAKPQEFSEETKSSSSPDDKFINRLLKALEENNIEGFDYLEYKQSLQNLSNVDMDEAMKYQSALAMAKTMGATPEKLISSAEHYVKILGAEEAKFKQAFAAQRERLVQSRQQSFVQLEKAIATKEKQIEQLQLEITEHKKKLEVSKAEVNQSNAKVQSTGQKFYGSYNIVVNQINADIAKMKQFLK